MASCLKCKKNVYESGFCVHHFKEYFESKVRKTIRQYSLFSQKEKIAVAASGGKDSTTILYILKKLKYNVLAITIDAGVGKYSRQNLANLREFCKTYKITLKEFSFRKEFGYTLCYLVSVLKSRKLNYSSCTVCGILRRYLLNKAARKLMMDVIATGHNLDDEAQAFIMNIFRNDLLLAKRQGPFTGSGKTKSFVKRVKPLYFCMEKEVKAYSRLMKFPVVYEKCPCSTDAYRKNYRDMLNDFQEKFPSTKYNIVNFFLRTVYLLKDQKESDIRACEVCQGPASRKICKKCEIILSIRK